MEGKAACGVSVKIILIIDSRPNGLVDCLELCLSVSVSNGADITYIIPLKVVAG